MLYKDKFVLITKGASFIGSHLVNAPIYAVADVTVVDDLSNGPIKNLDQSVETCF